MNVEVSPVNTRVSGNFDVLPKEGLPSGFNHLDQFFGGFKPEDLIIIAGRSAIGKTTFALNLAKNISINQNNACAYFTTNCSKNILGRILAGIITKIPVDKIKFNLLNDDETKKIKETESLLNNSPLYIFDSCKHTPKTIYSEVEKINSFSNISLIIIDFFQGVFSDETVDSEDFNLQKITSIKAIANIFKIPVILLIDLPDDIDLRDEKRPNLDDLNALGILEINPELVCFLYKEDYYFPKEYNGGVEIIESNSGHKKHYFRKDNFKKTEFIFARNYYGSQGTVYFSFHVDTCLYKFPEF